MTDHPLGRVARTASALSRRQVLGISGASLGVATAATWGFVKGLPGPEGSLTVVPPPPPIDDRPAANSANEAGGFASRDASFAAANGDALANAADANLYRSAGEAAKSTKVTRDTILDARDPTLHLLRRTTFGPTPDLVDEVRAKGIDLWLKEQLDPDTVDDPVADQVWDMFPMASMSPDEIDGAMDRYAWDAMFEYGQATLGRQLWSNRQLFEVMVDFWSNHLNVSTPGNGGWNVACSYHNDVIRANTLGSFTDMLLAANQHPAMLRYLSNDLSDKDDVNENLGRELLELHTVGVSSGYTEDDVRNSAYILTGRTVATVEDEDASSTFVFMADRHWKDEVRVLDFVHPNPTREGGMEVGDEYLRYLASHPSTAKTIAHKLAVRFVADDPPATLVDRMAAAYLDSGTEVKPVLDVLFRSGEFWAAVGMKVRRPLENVTASARAVGVLPGGDTRKALEGFYWWVAQMGQRPLAWPSPDGYPDVRQAWRSTSALLHAWNFHRNVVQGWQEGLTFVESKELVAGRATGTVGEYLDSLCQRLCLQSFRPEHRNALLGFVEEADAAMPTDQGKIDGLIDHLAPIVLDSPYFMLR